MKTKILCLIFICIVLCGCREPINEKEEQEIVAVYLHITLDKEDENVDIFGVENMVSEGKSKQLKEKYNRIYKSYYNNECLGEYKGNVEIAALYAFWEVGFEDESAREHPRGTVYIAGDFDPYPRFSEKIEPEEILNLDKILSEINREFEVSVHALEAIAVDLDGCGKKEYLLWAATDDDDYSLYFLLLDSDTNIVSYLLAFTRVKTQFKTIYNNWHDNLENTYKEMIENTEKSEIESANIIDYDNDGILEILVEMPIYEGIDFRTYEYDRGEFDGEFINTAWILP